jgi:hypothetical protein
MAVTKPMPVVSERCAQCGAPLADDQRYCLQCGEPHARVSGPLSGPLLAKQAADAGPHAPPAWPGQSSSPPLAPGMPGSTSTGRNNSLALLAGVGVLLLAMGVGVLIGRAGAGTAKTPPAQVISLGAPAAGASATPTTSIPTTTAPETPATSLKKKKEEAKAKGTQGGGSSITKPAPPSAAQNLRSGGSGQSYEQKSKNLPNVVSTG